MDGGGSDVPGEFVCDFSSGGGSFILALNHICDYELNDKIIIFKILIKIYFSSLFTRILTAM